MVPPYEVPPPTIDTGPISPPVDTTTPGTEVLGEQLNRPPATTPVAFVGATPGWVMLTFVLLVLGMALISRVIGADPIGLGAAGDSSRVAAVLVTAAISLHDDVGEWRRLATAMRGVPLVGACRDGDSKGLRA